MDIQQIKHQLDIEEVAASYGLTFDARGRGKCYFAENHEHGDANPSCLLDRQKQTIHCFKGCFGDKPADVIDLVQRIDGTDRATALRKCADLAGVKGPRVKKPTGKRRGRPPKPTNPDEVLALFRRNLQGSDVEQDLLERRGLTPDVIDRFELGDANGKLAIPFRDSTGAILGYKLHKAGHLRADGNKAKRGEGVRAQLYPLDNLDADPVWIVGGEPDVWRVAVENVAAVTTTTGESSWRREWTAQFADRDVVVCYDADDAGKKGQAELVRQLKPVARRLRVVTWPDDTPTGHDITDWLQAGNTLDALPLDEIRVSRYTLDECKQTVGKWLQLSEHEDELIDVVLGAVVANRFSGDPVWLLFVGPPGIIKTEILRTLSGWHETYTLSTLTAATLVSGYTPPSGEDPSLLPKLNDLVLIIKDFTAILDLPHETRQQVLGDLRDAYDGEMTKAFGSDAQTRTYRSKFGILAAVTPVIDKHWSVTQQLGERFLKVRICAHDSRSRVARAMRNSGDEQTMRRDLAEAMEGVLYNTDVTAEHAISIPGDIVEQLVDLADVLATLRSAVDRSGYTHEVLYVPEPEIGTRLVKQFTKLCRGIAAVRGKDAVDASEFDLIRRIARDTLPSKRREIVGAVYGLGADWASTQEIADELNMPTETCKRSLEDLRLLGVADRQGEHKYTWRMVPRFRERLAALELFPADATGAIADPVFAPDSDELVSIPA